ncbi:type IV conjugative transfer system protein TraE [Azohydromonas lata]|uniref:Type IV conjugative transfer system protein TraE n=1 Tax=Azohydromonas lata TaxID=45677 RepID=A0ABU5I7I2_9BURK|nr:type IV conjugative transfer system protein TraE [Azohydromonas lata]MDZ5455057.1 type IV conjugative transfer system protein TraE [Azohydromonas lata]
MDPNARTDDVRMLKKDKRMLGTALVVCGFALILSLLIILKLIGSERTIVEPPDNNRTFWVTSSSASQEYLEQMAGYVAWLVLDVSPSSIDWKKETLLKYVEPDMHGEFKTAMELEAQRLRKNNAATSFEIKQFNTDEAQQLVLVTGRLRRLVNGVDVSEPRMATFRAQFRLKGGRVHLRVFKEVANVQSQPALGAVVSGAAAR